jgi:quinol monooxygenase YgiN
MSEAVSWVVELAVKPGKLEEFRTLMNEMVESTQTEPGTLAYEWFVSDDGSVVQIYERYADSDATMAHVRVFGEKFAERFLAAVDVPRFDIFGEPSDQVKEAFGALNPRFFGTFGGFAR